MLVLSKVFQWSLIHKFLNKSLLQKLLWKKKPNQTKKPHNSIVVIKKKKNIVFMPYRVIWRNATGISFAVIVSDFLAWINSHLHHKN